ncbi:hypothetical protein PAPYR_13527 [Paratrimastix pyriformis]|uniref:Glutaminase A central domain-containing protein n=1 Tax=Paratrimastix pyriformis TaxID=342808 RepID=A0ABQ8U056_9EUKA|nr:hypothetical protein PAPYR_13527 [Paratrimastix pyriformis]
MAAGAAFDKELEASLFASGGQAYQEVGSLVYRQVTGSCKLTTDEKTGEVRYWMKEISSDGDISTVDVIFPASPFFALFNPELLWLQMLPVMEYALNETAPGYLYTLPWAPHHLGTWPVADIKPAEQENMPRRPTCC